MAWWREALKDGPRRSDEVYAAARRHGISKGTLRRAKRDLDIRCPRQMENGHAVPYFMFKHQQLPSKPGFEEVDAWLRSLDEERVKG